MSATSWDICPRCQKKAEEKTEKAKKLVEESYGKVSRHEYSRLLRDATERPKMESTLREDYQLGIYTSVEAQEVHTFYVSYRCSCSDCGFEHSYEYEQGLDLDRERGRIMMKFEAKAGSPIWINLGHVTAIYAVSGLDGCCAVLVDGASFVIRITPEEMSKLVNNWEKVNYD